MVDVSDMTGMSRALMGYIVDEVFDGAIEDTKVIEDIYAAIKRHEAQTPPPSTHVAGLTISAAEVKALLYGVPKYEFSTALSRLAAWLAENDDETPTPPGNQIRTAECDGKDAVPVTGQLPVGTASTRSRLDKETEQKLREALRFAASRSVMSSEQEQRILAAIATTEGSTDA